MSPLLRRILIHGLLVAIALAGVGYLLAAGALTFINSLGGELRIEGQPSVQMPLVMAVAGVALVALFEWWSDRRARAKAAKTPPPTDTTGEPKP